MAKEAIRSTALVTDDANTYFQNRIEGDSFRDDVSLLSAARALFDKRLKDGETIGFSAEDKHAITYSEGVSLPGMTLKVEY